MQFRFFQFITFEIFLIELIVYGKKIKSAVINGRKQFIFFVG